MSYLRANGFRLALSLAGALAVFVAPWWVAVVCMLFLSLRYPAWEVIGIGLLMDFMWLPGAAGSHLPFFALSGVAMVWLCAPLRNQLLRQ